MARPTFGDWGTCVDPSVSPSPLTITLNHGDECFIECATGYIGHPRQTVIPAGQQGPASRWALQTCTLGNLSGPGPGAMCLLPETCELLLSRDVPANATWGTCTTTHPTNSSIRLLNHGETCEIMCDRDFNVSTAPGETEISCNDGIVTNDMSCVYTDPPEPEPEPSEWEDEGHWVIYDTEGTFVLECTSAEDQTYRYVVPATGEGCPDSDDVTNELAQIYDDQYEGERSGDPCVWDPLLYQEYPSAAGINLTLAWAYEDMEAEYQTRGDFQAAFELEMSDLLQVDARRLKTFRTFRDDGIAITGAGTPQEQEITMHRTVVEFIIQLEEPITNTDEELDPTQAAGLLIEYYYNQGQDDDHPRSVLYKYSSSLKILSRIDQTAGLDVIVTCGQNPCEPTHQGVLEWLIAGLFVSSACIVACVVMCYGRGKLAWIVN